MVLITVGVIESFPNTLGTKEHKAGALFQTREGYQPLYNIEGKITECWLVETVEIFFLIFFSLRAKLPTTDWLSGKNTCSWLAEHAISTFSWFLHLVPRQRKLLSSSLEFDFLSRIVCAKNTWKSSATATKEIPKGELSFLTRNSKRFVSKAKILIRFAWLKNWNHSRLWPSGGVSSCYSFFQQTITEWSIITVPFWWEEGRSRSNSVEEIVLQVPSLDPRFAIFIDLC